MLVRLYVCMHEQKKIRTSIVMYPWVKKAIKRVTTETGQAISDFIHDAVVEKLAELGITPPQDYKNLSELVLVHRDWLLSQTELGEELLQQIIDGHAVDHITRLRLALALEMTEAEITQLNNKQPHHQNGEREKCHQQK